MAKVSTSAAEARTMGLFAASDRITLNRERLLLDAKAQAATLLKPATALRNRAPCLHRERRRWPRSRPGST